jgi:hypothetical protein
MAEASKGKNDSVHEQRQDPILAEEIEGTSKPEVSNKAFASKRTNACMSNLPPFLNSILQRSRRTDVSKETQTLYQTSHTFFETRKAWLRRTQRTGRLY